MPELPEVETIAGQLNKSLKGKVVKGIEALREKSFKGKSEMLTGKQVKQVWRKSKMVVMDFVGWEKVLLVHLKMTGQLVLVEKGDRIVGGHPTADWINDLPSKHTRVVINFKDGSKLFFNDMRVFGWVKILEEKIWKQELSSLPPDVVDKEFTVSLFKKLLSGSKRAIKLVVMDQKKIGGVGNIYANDGLFLALIDPKKPANELSKKEAERLWKAVKKVVKKAVVLGGASYSDYKDTKGLGGRYQDHFLVYGRDGEVCKKCGKKIEKIKLGGRGTYWCPNCQMR